MTTDMTEGPTVADRISELGTDYDEEESTDAVRQDLLEDGVDLPELADTMEEATARAAASTYLYALRNVEREFGANDAEHKTLLEYYRTRHTERQIALERRTAYLRSVLEGLFGFMKVTGKKKSLNLLGGRLGMRSQQEELTVEDDAKVVAWVATDWRFASLVRTKRSVDLAALRKHMKAQADPPPGVTLDERPDVFFATPAD